MIGDFNWVNNEKEVDYMYGGEDWLITDEDIDRLRKGEILNLFVNMEYGCSLKYVGGNEKMKTNRVEENRKMLDQVSMMSIGTPEIDRNLILMDISQSLSVIADALTSKEVDHDSERT